MIYYFFTSLIIGAAAIGIAFLLSIFVTQLLEAVTYDTNGLRVTGNFLVLLALTVTVGYLVILMVR